MRRDINLLTATELKKYVVNEKDIKARNASILLVSGFLLVVLFLFVYLFNLRKEINRVDTKVAEKEQSIEQMKDAEVLYKVSKSKIKAASDLIRQRPELLPILDLLENATPKGVIIAGINIPTADKISLSGSAKNPQVLEEFFNTLTQKEDIKKNLNEVKLGTLGRTKTSEYKFDLLIVIKGSGEKNAKI